MLKEKISDITPLFVLLIAIWIILLMPFRIIGYNFLPPDDALRHSAKVISEKDWNQILVLRDDIKMDSHPGWHAILTVFYKSTHCDALSLVLFSVIFLFILFCLPPLLFLRYPESWLLSLIAMAIAMPTWSFRLFLGRPYIFTMSCLIAILFLWPELKDKNKFVKASLVIIFLIAASTWVHCSWYLFALPLAALMIAREWRASILFGICAIIGVTAGASLTGHPFIFLKQTIQQLFLAFGNNDMERMLVGEFRPGLIDANAVILLMAMLGWRRLRGGWSIKSIDSPAFILVILCMILGLITRRIWVDWGVPSLACWMAIEFDEFFRTKVEYFSWKRILPSSVIAAVLFLSVTEDINSRWSSLKPRDYISSQDPTQAGWLPEQGGIIYSDNMDIFFKTFFKNPKAQWRYMLGFESALMPKEDLVIFRNIQRNFSNYKMFEPWVKKMRPEDRLILNGSEDLKPKIPELEWKYIAIGVWSGRKPQQK